ncbi:Gfo/Idh/MocA family protein [Yaniella halotolerans]|uniref:Gfo/Idh/MocA family protein n=1 Tax=Yaniella halotolerans TaxID=225453 RepID=UPI0003B458EE|nr:Gfo/Idh/MocA family oxidoreductase [Yaniella halotolerans]
MAELRAGLIGLGYMGRHHARILRSLEGVELVALADQYGDPYAVARDLPLLPDLDALLDVGVDYLVIATPTESHETLGLQAAAAGIPTLLEKPLSKSYAAASRLVTAFADRGVLGATGHIERYNPALQELRKRLEFGELGEIYQIATRRQGPFPNRVSDVGVVKDLASHDIDITAWVTQRDYEVVGARTVFKTGRDNEDMLSSTCQLSDGLVSNHLVNWLTPTKERVTIITGERGMFVADTLTADLTFYENGSHPTVWDDLAQFRGVSEGNVTRLAIHKPEPLVTEHESFRDAVLGKHSDVVTLEQGAQVLRVCEAMIKSATNNTFVTLE